MPRHSIDYLNARKDTAARKGRTIFAKASTIIDQRAQWASMCPLERAIIESDRLFADFDSWFADRQPIAEMLAGKSHSHGMLLAPGESPDDMVF